ncbi:MAG: HAD family phosphatase, partial [Phocaeicola sp.]
MDKTKTIAALFDFDGVVMDTESQYTIYWNEVGRKYHPETENFGLIIKGQ